jgi:hypothetical protein
VRFPSGRHERHRIARTNHLRKVVQDQVTVTAARFSTLDRNYRSTLTVLAADNGVIGLAKERFTKNLWTERSSAEKPQLVSVRHDADRARFIVERTTRRPDGDGLWTEQLEMLRCRRAVARLAERSTLPFARLVQMGTGPKKSAPIVRARRFRPNAETDACAPITFYPTIDVRPDKPMFHSRNSLFIQYLSPII